MACPLRVAVFALCIAGSASTAQAQATAASAPSLDSTVADYCAAWGTGDRSARDQLLERVFAPDGTYADPAPTHAEGRRALSDVIGDLSRRQPGGRFRCSRAQSHHGMMRFTWVYVDAQGKEQLQGMDFGELTADGRIRRIVGFFGPPPAVRQ